MPGPPWANDITDTSLRARGLPPPLECERSGPSSHPSPKDEQGYVEERVARPRRRCTAFPNTGDFTGHRRDAVAVFH